ncbi:PIG-L family deacetylase [Arcticibacter sp. MXS-1]|uniref:PIG-L family deacetylase n=1 Tax=Arcticibacter sp. MXS-1 TaxID=3341726 RepID=UPI0035A877CB
MSIRLRSLFLFLAISSTAAAQQVRPASSVEIQHKLLQLNRLVNVLYFAAHPDDENTRLLAWLVNDQHVRTAYLSLTRGDGGQNILGREQGAALGLIRTYELLEARKIDGAEQFFTRAVDFGFSKNSDETFEHWNQELLTEDAAWTIRSFRPDVIICRFPPDYRAGHGQHAASAIIAAKAFLAAGNKDAFKAQLQSLSVWQPRRILLNTYRFGSNNTTAESQFKVATGQYKPQIGMGYSELAGKSRSVHRSQGAGTPSVPGIQTEYFALVDGEPLSSSLFDGIDITWNRVGRKDIGDHLSRIIASFDYTRPDKGVPELLKLRKEIRTVKDSYWRAEKLNELDRLILDCAGFMAEFYTGQPEAVGGDRLSFTFNAIARSETPVSLESLKWPGRSESLRKTLGNDLLFSASYSLDLPANAPVSEPYWLSRPGKDPFHYYAPSDSIRGLPEAPNELAASAGLTIGDEHFSVQVPLSYKRLDPVKGDIAEALRVVPAVITSFTNNLLVANDKGELQAGVRLHAMKEITNASLSVVSGNQELSRVASISLKANTDTVIQLTMRAPAVTSATKENAIRAVVKAGGNEFSRAQHLIHYDHIPTLQYFTPAEAKVLSKNWKVTVKKIGYIEGAGDYTADFLRLAGLEVTVLKDEDFASAASLAQYDAIVTGVRAVNTEKRMSYWLPVLHQYVRNGGTLVMQYNTLQDLSTRQIGPYPFELANLRVTEEDADVTLTDPAHRLFNYPNKISKDDFAGWVQERGLYFPGTWDSHYQTLFSMHDKGEEALKGSTLYTPYGKGHYIYTSLAFFRQLPAGNRGAVRLLMNMLSVGK